MDLELKGRIAIVTGGSRGLGKAIAELLACEGAAVAVTWRHEESRAEDLVATIKAQGSEAIHVKLDLGDLGSIRSAVERVTAQWGRIDILINNAVEWGPKTPAETPTFEELPAEEWQPLLRSNIDGTFAAIQCALPSMRRHKWGRIVNISSCFVDDGHMGSGWYSAAKSSLHGLSRTLSKELGPSGILVNVVMPGLVLTDRASEIQPATRHYVARSSPIRRLLQPLDVARMTVFLCSGANTAVTGEVIRVSGGKP